MNVSRACITIPAGYVCVVRLGTAQDQPFQGRFLGQESISCLFVCPSLPMPRPNNIGVVKKISKIVLGLEAEPQIRGLPTSGGYHYLLVTSVAHSNKQKQRYYV